MVAIDIKYNFGTEILVVRSCYHRDGRDLLAVAGEDAVQVLQCGDNAVAPIAYFMVGLRVTSIAWSPRTVSPGASDEWFLELVISTHDFGLYHLTKSYDGKEGARRFGGGLTGHHARVNDIAFVGGQDDNARHVATVSDDRTLIVWDLHPQIPEPYEETSSQSIPPEGRPTALAIPFAYPLCSISSHPSTSKEFIVSDSQGSVFLIDWRKDPNENLEDAFSHKNMLELVHPKSLGYAATNMARFLSGHAAWRADDFRVIGAVFGSDYAIWDINRLNGGKPFMTGPCFPEGGHRFRWCPVYTDVFAISTSSTTLKGASIIVNNTFIPQTQSTPMHVAPHPHRIADFDWVLTSYSSRIAAAVGREIYIFTVHTDD